MRISRSLLALFVATGVLTTGCGGGGSGGSAFTPSQPEAPSQPTSAQVSGTVATGAPLAGAAVKVTDKTGAIVATATADAAGKYTVSIPLAAVAPFVITATLAGTTLYSPLVSTAVTTANVTPVTTLIAAQLSPTGDPAALASQVQAGTATINATVVTAVVADVTRTLQPVATNVGAPAIDPISGTFNADGTGYDRVLNSVIIDINPAGTSSNITITVKSVVTGDAQAPEVTFTSGTTPPALPATVATATLPPVNTDTMMAGFLTKLQDCLALPVGDRVTGTTTLADTVKAPVCREVFFDNDPATFKNNGARVNFQGAFASMFRAGATGVKLDSPKLQFQRDDGTMLVSWRSTATNGDVSYSRVLLKPQNGALKAFGNQYDYSFVVRPWAETRALVNTTLSYRATGFDVGVNNAVVNGTSVFNRVILTAPNGRKITMRPQAGLSFMTVVRPDNTSSGTGVVRLAGKFLDANLATRQPRQLTGENIFWAINPAGANTDWTDAEIASINNVGRWKAEFFYAANTTATPDFVQYAETSSRPLTLAEMGQRTWAGLTPALQSEVVGLSSATGFIQLNEGDVVDVSANNNTDAWQVPAGANAPTTIQAQGFVSTNGARWNDSITVSPSARKVIINCSKQTQADAHCSATTAGAYSGVARLNLLQLFAFDQDDVEWVTTNGLFKVALP